ncbi:hypothetical protein BGE01nite_56680 [Brevifollis gellanilyticus]|uniref:Uncharacterized protein n=1 Tax=Brevifollis gellanilyticus TaxID=748831 RepID=A0A512MI11_9BACT|nr:hypothetical protein BGE01nite_56680 [Brevifollis gellanilyticus]
MGFQGTGLVWTGFDDCISHGAEGLRLSDLKMGGGLNREFAVRGSRFAVRGSRFSGSPTEALAKEGSRERLKIVN